MSVLRRLREESQADVADVLGITKEGVNMIEGGRLDPSRDRRAVLEEHFGIPYTSLVQSADSTLIRDILAFIRGRILEPADAHSL
jgi:transcriptional regulator with XRE-family HTH domain